MKIAIIGQQDFGKAVLEAFLARKDEVAGVFCAPEKPGARPDALKVAAQEKGVKVFQFASLKSDEAKKALKDLNVELGIMAFVLQFAPQDFVNIPKRGTIQFHPSLLPKYRGPSSINWPISRGEPRTGLTIFRPTDGLMTDSGTSPFIVLPIWLAFKIAGVTFGSLLGVFLLGLVTRVRANRANVAAMVAMAAVNLVLLTLAEMRVIALGWSWLVIVGTGGTMLLAWLLAPVLDRARAA
jgi:hypothetical protein